MWLIPPSHRSASSPCAPASVEWNSDCDLQSRRLAQSAWWRGRAMSPAFWRARCSETANWSRALCGWGIFASFEDERGAEASIASRAGILASPTRSPEPSSVAATTAGCSTTLFASCARYGLVVSCGRTSSGVRMSSLKQPSAHWRGWATALRAEFSARRKSERRTRGNAFSSLRSERETISERGQWQTPGTVQFPTPTAHDAKGTNSAKHMTRVRLRNMKRNANHTGQLANFVVHSLSHPDDPAWHERPGEHGPQPAILRTPDVSAHRVDEVRAIGNAVVPVVVARAFLTLGATLTAYA